MSADCRDCRAGLGHCHGTIIRHTDGLLKGLLKGRLTGRLLGRTECTEPGCVSPEELPHTFVVDCDAVGCDCADLAELVAELAARAV
jgi:hypothetical protein